MLVTFSLDRRKESNILKAYFQAVPKIVCGGHYISWNGTVTSPYYPSYYPPNIDCHWIIRAPLPGYRLLFKLLVIQVQEQSLGSSKCDRDWLEIDGVSKCDGWKDCTDGSDEVDCGCDPVETDCGNGKCRRHSRTCKGDDSCESDSHEEDSCLYKSCSQRAYKCLNGKCPIKLNPECDGIRDCADGSDEMNCVCGRNQVKKTRIVGGEDARSGKWPWQASLQLGTYGHICGASIISNRWLISAAHCFLDSDSIRYSTASDWTAYMGIRIINKNNYNHIAMRSIKRIIVHPHYDQYISDYDIALLEMEAPVFFNELVSLQRLYRK
ncbi:suppressor of tumorigenicity 14 protein homolog isoform X2 [Sphaerodactylus townsendi]|uniref:suppressor of tumorigenicity 14 protein homolog isoform X2 n=1 Tax=Sphaerodactylus townsendi TaxID=933632 RepID=UPI0020263950|nr:suppressor of tumorigenicity 14 protein homolog isoform X2 [Sphaerodactylus townsendi]